MLKLLRTLNDRKFVGGFAAGVAVCVLAFAPMFFTATGAAETALTASQGNRAALESCTQKLVDINSHWTLIQDASASTVVPAAQLLHGLMAIAPGEALTGVSAGNAGPVNRWAVPAKVQPFIYGPANGAKYFYWNPETHELQGPFVPQQGDAQKP